MHTIQSQPRLLYFDALRVIATFFVIVLHACSSNFHDVNVYSLEWKLFNFYDALSRWTVPLFIMLSGGLFLSRPTDVGKLYGKYMLRIAAAFVVWSVLYVFEYQWMYGELYPLDRSGIITHLITGHYHLWFLLMLLGLYAVVPLLKPIAEDERLIRYFLTLTFGLSVLLPYLVDIGKYCLPTVSAAAQANQPKFGLSFGYLFYFVLGHWMMRHDTTKWRVPIYVLGIIGFGVTFVVTDMVSVDAGKLDSTFYDYNTLNVLLETVWVFQLFKDIVPKLPAREKWENALSAASKLSFGVYLLHPFVLDFLEKVVGLHTLSFTAVLSVPVVSGAAFVLSFGLSYVLNRIPIVNRYIV